ncbi:hypothetical protein IH879_15325 [candidate division KSB1 bacterium]|nr:hypothetical protein [candidate division KSB1 bacterium]
MRDGREPRCPQAGPGRHGCACGRQPHRKERLLDCRPHHYHRDGRRDVTPAAQKALNLPRNDQNDRWAGEQPALTRLDLGLPAYYLLQSCPATG